MSALPTAPPAPTQPDVGDIELPADDPADEVRPEVVHMACGTCYAGAEIVVTLCGLACHIDELTNPRTDGVCDECSAAARRHRCDG